MRLRSILTTAAGSIVVLTLTPAGASQGPPSPSTRTMVMAGAPSAQENAILEPPLVRFRKALANRVLTAPAVSGVPIKESVRAFVERAAVSTPDEREQVRSLIAASAQNEAVATELASSVFEHRTRDYSFTLTALGVLGEMRHPAGQAALTKFLAIPLPETGHTIDGEITERATLEKLQMKAIDGLAYARTPAGDREVLRIAGLHPSRAVRAEAIAAYLYNHENSADARAALLAVVRPDEKIFIDRPSFVPGMSGDAFNAQLASYLRLHPELHAPDPGHAIVARAEAERDRAKDAATLVRPVRPVRLDVPVLEDR
jgi:hypothetical protein